MHRQETIPFRPSKRSKGSSPNDPFIESQESDAHCYINLNDEEEDDEVYVHCARCVETDETKSVKGKGERQGENRFGFKGRQQSISPLSLSLSLSPIGAGHKWTEALAIINAGAPTKYIGRRGMFLLAYKPDKIVYHELFIQIVYQ
ncbi:hypothetical protein DM860_008176 [Cuscuta australis]|uniref:Uncharacterized protein n=1 Tax=Cuscuta australis TaxID=267555 RepID=A0A328D3H3_9ASTE|nr:hypothetical protein DM860_008176 [Cuscuta australis]